MICAMLKLDLHMDGCLAEQAITVHCQKRRVVLTEFGYGIYANRMLDPI